MSVIDQVWLKSVVKGANIKGSGSQVADTFSQPDTLRLQPAVRELDKQRAD